MRAIVCGGRYYTNVNRLEAELDRLGVTFVIEGGASGADALAAEWAQKRGVPSKEFTADWKTHGWKAGKLRNQQMLDEGEPDVVIAFPGEAGTADMIWKAMSADVQVIEIKE